MNEKGFSIKFEELQGTSRNFEELRHESSRKTVRCVSKMELSRKFEEVRGKVRTGRKFEEVRGKHDGTSRNLEELRRTMTILGEMEIGYGGRKLLRTVNSS